MMTGPPLWFWVFLGAGLLGALARILASSDDDGRTTEELEKERDKRREEMKDDDVR